MRPLGSGGSLTSAVEVSLCPLHVLWQSQIGCSRRVSESRAQVGQELARTEDRNPVREMLDSSGERGGG